MAIYKCPDCAYVYNEDIGDEHQGYTAGTLFADLPNDFVCPACFVQEKEDFILVTNDGQAQGTAPK